MGSDSNSDGTVGKALDVLDMVALVGRPVRFGELLTKSAYPKATLYRFLQTLTNQGMLAYDEDRSTYTLGVRLVRLAHVAWTQSSLAPLARPYLDDLAAETGETVHLAQMDMGQVLYVDKRNAIKPVEMFSSAGKVGPAYCTGVGKAMLAHLPEDKLAAARRFYNSAVQDYNTAREQFPGSIIAGSFNFEPREFFDVGVEGRSAMDEPPKVAF